MKMKTLTPILSILTLIFFISCNKNAPKKNEPVKIKTDENYFINAGRVDTTQVGDIVLIGSASSVKFKASGDHCTIQLKNRSQAPYSFVSIEIDDIYIKRIKVEGNTFKSHKIDLKADKKFQTVAIYKATEAQTGDIIFGGVTSKKAYPITQKEKKKIEFIGNSITCGMGVDYEEIPCESGEWFDQHNAYFAYGPRIGRILDVDYMLSSSSGIGIYRNWDVDGPVMPDVYENRYLNTDTTKTWDFKKFSPDLVSICLGTNDLSDGDGVHPRLPFDPEAYTKKYIEFINTIYSHYPNVQIALLSSPMVEGEKSEILNTCLKNIKNHFDEVKVKKSIAIYSFNERLANGCSTHPNKNDHKLIAEKLVPFYKNLL